MRLYRLLLRAYPGSFRTEYQEPMIQMYADQRRDEGSSARLWFRLLSDLARSVAIEHGRRFAAMLGRRRQLPWGTVILVGALTGAATAVSGARTGGFDRGVPGSLAESTALLVAANFLVIAAFTGAVLSGRVKRSPQMNAGLGLMLMGQLSVIGHELGILTGASVPSLGAASAFPVMLGSGLVAAAMWESTEWSRWHAVATTGFLVFPFTLIFGAYPVVVSAMGSEVAADLVFKAGHMVLWALVGIAFALTTSRNSLPPTGAAT